MSRWMPVPIEEVIVDLLKRKGGMAKDKELCVMLKSVLGDVSQRELDKALLKLELHDVLRVSSAKKGVRLVTLIKQGGS
ncbi:MAG: hypothetical protein N3H31_04515 [Candidatus Nezhaarchaeota archaeon]|nr:hypothetical protein [Candidatus Nezhaarchaeota archaeon]